MKVVFLDIDGVLNTSETFKQKKSLNQIEIDIKRVGYLKEIIEQTGAHIVLSSSWRNNILKKDGKLIPLNHKNQELIKILGKFGLEIYDITPNDPDMRRENEILSWMKNKDIESFVVLDDDSYDLKDFVNNGLIKTSFTKDGEMLTNMDDCCGLCKEHIKTAIEILNAKEKKKIKQIK